MIAAVFILTFLSGGLCLLAALPALYLGGLALFAGRHPTRTATQQELRFGILVPAHNESAGISATVQSLLALAWPQERFCVVVVADNCTDDTAAKAEQAGARVLVRADTERRGKGYALELGFQTLLESSPLEAPLDAVVVVDADTVVDAHLLSSFAARLEQGAWALQAEYGVRNVDASWRTRMMALALAMFHTLRSNARERLGLSAGLRGNGMCFSRQCLKDHPPRAYGLVEDVEHGIALGRAGVRVWAVTDAHVRGEMVSSAKASESQRRRWEEGRVKLKREVLPPLVREALGKRDKVLLDLALDLLVPPLSSVALLIALGVVVEAARLLVFFATSPALLWGPQLLLTACWAGAVGLFSLYVLRGVQLSGLGFQAFVLLLQAPGYIAWKLWLKLKGNKTKEGWVRTAREGGDGPPP